MLSQEEVSEIVAGATEEIQKAVIEKTKESVSNEIAWCVKEKVREQIGQFVVDEVMPAVKAQLSASKDEYIDAAISLCSKIGDSVRDALVKRVVATLSDDWKLKKVVKELVDIPF